MTSVTHLQTQTSKFEIYSADNLLFRHCQRKGRLKHLPAHISWLLQQDLQLFCLRTQNLKCNLPNNLPRDGFISIFLRDLWRCFFSGFANPCPTICRDDFHPNITVNNRGSAELVHPCSKLSENHCKFASEMGVCKKMNELIPNFQKFLFQLI